MKWLALISGLKAVFAALWKPVTGFLLARQLAKTRDLKAANEVRRRAQAVKEKYDEKLPHINDDALDRRLHDLRSKK
jgi:F0F1-type ATP synthase membrane subunit b/b'